MTVEAGQGRSRRPGGRVRELRAVSASCMFTGPGTERFDLPCPNWQVCLSILSDSTEGCFWRGFIQLLIQPSKTHPFIFFVLQLLQQSGGLWCHGGGGRCPAQMFSSNGRVTHWTMYTLYDHTVMRVIWRVFAFVVFVVKKRIIDAQGGNWCCDSNNRIARQSIVNVWVSIVTTPSTLNHKMIIKRCHIMFSRLHPWLLTYCADQMYSWPLKH